MVKKDVKTARREYLSLKAEKGYDNETERLFSGRISASSSVSSERLTPFRLFAL